MYAGVAGKLGGVRVGMMLAEYGIPPNSRPVMRREQRAGGTKHE